MISLFLRSYEPDFVWLEYSIKSMRKNLLNISERVLAVPQHTTVPTSISNFFDHIVYIQETHEGYVQQQIDKIRAYKYCSNDYILFSDSDCIYYDKFDPYNKIEHGKIILPKTKYELVESAIIWEDITYTATGIEPEYEYMRCFQILHHKEVLQQLDNDEHFNAYLSVVTNRELSEFNAIGIIAETYFKHRYIFLDTETSNTIVQSAKQYWSWGGISEDIQKELDTL